jgi:hypothetical protein
MISITFKTITSKDIIYKDDKIQQITSIDFAKGKIILNKPLCSADSQNISDTPEIEESECKLIRTNWEKYLEFLREK